MTWLSLQRFGTMIRLFSACGQVQRGTLVQEKQIMDSGFSILTVTPERKATFDQHRPAIDAMNKGHVL
jgi:hypothetical protein